MDKIFEISTNLVKVSNLSLEEFENIFNEEKENIVKFLKENFDNPEKISYLNFKINYGEMTYPYGQTLYMDKGDEQYERSYNLLNKSENWNKAIGYRIFIREQYPNESNPRQLSGLAFGEIEFLFDEELTKELKEKDTKLTEEVAKFYADSRTNFIGE